MEISDSNSLFIFDSNEYKLNEKEIIDLKLKPQLSNKYYKIKIDQNKKMVYWKWWNCYSGYWWCGDDDLKHREKTQKQQQVKILLVSDIYMTLNDNIYK